MEALGECLKSITPAELKFAFASNRILVGATGRLGRARGNQNLRLRVRSGGRTELLWCVRRSQCGLEEVGHHVGRTCAHSGTHEALGEDLIRGRGVRCRVLVR